MNRQKYSRHISKLFRILSPTLLFVLLLPSHLLAEPSSFQVSVHFPSGENKGKPLRTSGGGKRGNSLCLKLDPDKPTLTALMPTRDNKSFTTSKQPNFYFYVPPTSAQTGEFILRNKEEEDIVQASFKLPKQPGIVKLQIPPTVALETGESYKWYFTIVCNKNDRSADEYTEGTIERKVISPSVNKALQESPPLRQANIYAKYYMWSETITNVLQIRQEKPNQWKELMESVGLEIIADEPVVPITELSQQI
ncbi:MAG: DUF928 domain-containing protein [Sphaerospermopsis sp. SIO1G2]|nr:DUF928 domain-containing protein [Sphaerospermopsis sp. SIO1G2]